MERPRIRHVALNVQDRDKEAEFYKKHFGMEEKNRGPNGTIYLSDGFVGVALINNPDMPWGINHFGFQVESVSTIETEVGTTAHKGVYGAVAEAWITDAEGYRVDVSEGGWPI